MVGVNKTRDLGCIQTCGLSDCKFAGRIGPLNLSRQKRPSYQYPFSVLSERNPACHNRDRPVVDERFSAPCPTASLPTAPASQTCAESQTLPGTYLQENPSPDR